jgi:hypothetical protein
VFFCQKIWFFPLDFPLNQSNDWCFFLDKSPSCPRWAIMASPWLEAPPQQLPRQGRQIISAIHGTDGTLPTSMSNLWGLHGFQHGIAWSAWSIFGSPQKIVKSFAGYAWLWLVSSYIAKNYLGS